MRLPAEVMRDLALSGMTPDQLALVMELSASLASESRPDPVAEKRRKYDRERKRKSTGIPPEPADDPPLNDIYSNPPVSEPNGSSRKRNRADHFQPIPDDWQPKPFGLNTQSRKIVDGWPPGDLEHQTEHFVAHHRKNGTKFKDWQDAWSTWVLNSPKFGNARNGHVRQPSPQPSLRGQRPNPSGDLRALADAAEARQAGDSPIGGGLGGSLPAYLTN